MDPLAFSVPPNDQPNVTQLDFHQSMSHFKTMFPSLDMDLIETVLRSNKGAVDQTIDQLLQISSETQANNLPSNPPAYSTSQNNYDKNLNLNSTPVEKVHKTNLKQLDLLSQPSQQLIDFDTVDSQAGASTTKKQSKFNPPLVGELPSDFLRITPQDKLNNQHSMAANQNLTRQSSNDHQFSQQLLKKKMEENERLRLSSNADKETVQYLEDERIAILLQNEEFVSELRRNKDFMHSLNFDTMNNTTKVKGIDNLNYNNETYTGTDAEDFKERIRKMGESTKNKFYQIAGLFSRRKGLPSRDNLLGDQHTQYNTLENDSDGEEYGNSVKKQVHK